MEVMVKFDNWDGLSRGVWMGGFHGRKIYEAKRTFLVHGARMAWIGREGLGVVWCFANL